MTRLSAAQLASCPAVLQRWLEAVADTASEVVIFGSRVAECSRENSDWDVLVRSADAVPALRDPRFQIVSVPVGASATERFMGTDLACHVARFGKWFAGHPPWSHHVRPEVARARKLRGAVREASILDEAWDGIAPARRPPHLRRIRLDLQRADALDRHGTVPPTAWLERGWNEARPDRRIEVLRPLQSAERQAPRVVAELFSTVS